MAGRNKPLVTAILLSWKRVANMRPIVDALRSQTVPVEIWTINNGADDIDLADDRYIHIPWNAGEWARYVFAGRAETEYVMFQDDDFMLGDETFLEDAIRLHKEKCPEHIIGVAGRGLQTSPPYYHPDIVNRSGRAAIIKGHFQLFKPEICHRVRIPRHPSASDIYWSLDAGNGHHRHWVSKTLAGRLVTLDRQGVGYEFRPEHYAERELVCATWLGLRKNSALVNTEYLRSLDYA